MFLEKSEKWVFHKNLGIQWAGKESDSVHIWSVIKETSKHKMQKMSKMDASIEKSTQLFQNTG